MSKFSSDIIEQVRAAVDIVDVIGAFIDLKPAGTNRLVGLCPFHQEKTPSFHVTRDKQLFYCFGCQRGGDVFKFLCDFEGISFGEALRRTAERAGIRLPAVTERDDREEYLRDRLFELNKHASVTLVNLLDDPLKGSSARQYLKNRKLSPETVKRFQLGYAPDDFAVLPDALRKAGFRDDVLEASGLVRKSDKGFWYAFFRNRLIIPIRDSAGRFIAFGGRDLSGDPNTAKYINTPENTVYKKGRELFGLFEAREALRAQKRALLVEGYFDLMRCFDVGIENVVASCGTALTVDQALRLRRYVPEVVVVYDGDPAGIRAALRGVAVLTAAGLTVRAIALPNGKDPDDFIREQGVQPFRGLVSSAPDFVTFYVHMNSDRLTSVEGRTEIVRELFTILLNVEDGLRCDEYLKRIAREVHTDYWGLRHEFQRVREDRNLALPTAKERASSEVGTLNHDDCAFVAALLQSEPLRQKVREEFSGIVLEPGPLRSVLHHLLNGEPFSDREGGQNSAATFLMAAAANFHVLEPERREEIVEKRLKRLKQETINIKIRQNGEAIRQAEQRQDVEQVKILMTAQIELKKELERIGSV